MADWQFLPIFETTTVGMLRKGVASANVKKSFEFIGAFRALWLPSLIAPCHPQMHIGDAFEGLHSESFPDETNAIEFDWTFSYTRGISAPLICSA
jgi:hypothetical protein